jgi:aryl-alcohol dehydrogenase-like predicted oxidoreductase
VRFLLPDDVSQSRRGRVEKSQTDEADIGSSKPKLGKRGEVAAVQIFTALSHRDFPKVKAVAPVSAKLLEGHFRAASMAHRVAGSHALALQSRKRKKEIEIMDRRTFVRLSLASGVGLSVTKAIPLLAEEFKRMSTTFKIGGDLTVNRLGFGAMRITGEGIWGWPKDRPGALKVLKRAVELGVNLIDTADAYGPETSEILIAEALHPYPKGLVIATKGGLTRPGPGQWSPNGNPAYLKQCVDQSLKRLKLERIDLYQLHRIDSKVPMEDSLGALKEARDAGKIRHVGLSEVSPEEVARARKVVPIVTVQNRYNLDDRKWDNTLAYCEKEGLGFMPWAPVGGNSGFHSAALQETAKSQNVTVYQLAIAWLLQRSEVMLPIPGTSSVAHLEENLAAARLKLRADDWKRLES